MKKSKGVVALMLAVACVLTMFGGCTIQLGAPKKASSDASSVSESKKPASSVEDKGNADSSAVESKDDAKASEADSAEPAAPANGKWQDTTRSTPVKVNQWATAKMYNVVTGKDEKVGVSVTKFHRGADENKIVKDYCASNADSYKWSEPKAGWSYVVADYSVDFTGFKMSDTGASTHLMAEICSKSSKYGIIDGNVSYTLDATDISDETYSTKKVGTGKIAFALPTTCKDYILTLGGMACDGDTAYIQGD